MNGLWKENIGGWNAKDTKRKRQTRNHTIRDRGKSVIKVFDAYKREAKTNPDIFRLETETVKISKGEYGTDKAIVTTAKVYRATITFHEVDADGNFIEDYRVKSEYSYSGWRVYHKKFYRTVNIFSDGNRGNYHNKGNHYIEKSGLSIAEHFGLTSRQVSWCEIGERRNTQRTVVLDEEMVKKAIERKNKIDISDHDEDGDFLYNKPLPAWKRHSFWGNGGKRRKYAQKKANRADRRNIRNWIDGHDISKEVKTHALSKSILWEIW